MQKTIGEFSALLSSCNYRVKFSFPVPTKKVVSAGAHGQQTLMK